MIGRANERLLVLDHEERIALVAQVVHDPDEPANIARVEADARFVHDEERVDERRAETGCEIDALHFAAAQGAGGAIEREITDADLAEIPKARADLGPQHPGGRVVRQKGQAGEKNRAPRRPAAQRTRAA